MGYINDKIPINFVTRRIQENSFRHPAYALSGCMYQEPQIETIEKTLIEQLYETLAKVNRGEAVIAELSYIENKTKGRLWA